MSKKSKSPKWFVREAEPRGEPYGPLGFNFYPTNPRVMHAALSRQQCVGCGHLIVMFGSEFSIVATQLIPDLRKGQEPEDHALALEQNSKKAHRIIDLWKEVKSVIEQMRGHVAGLETPIADNHVIRIYCCDDCAFKVALVCRVWMRAKDVTLDGLDGLFTDSDTNSMEARLVMLGLST